MPPMCQAIWDYGATDAVDLDAVKEIFLFMNFIKHVRSINPPTSPSSHITIIEIAL